MEQAIARGLTEFAALVQQQGVHAALAYLNRRTPHRYTGLFRFEGALLRSEVLVDGNQPLVHRGKARRFARWWAGSKPRLKSWMWLSTHSIAA
jgi:hypothetical protein